METGWLKDEYDGLKNLSQFIFPLKKPPVGHKWLLFRGFGPRLIEKEKGWCNFSSRTLYQIHPDTKFTDLYGGLPSNVRIFQERDCGNLRTQPHRGILKCLMESWNHFNKKTDQIFFQICAMIHGNNSSSEEDEITCFKSEKTL